MEVIEGRWMDKPEKSTRCNFIAEGIANTNTCVLFSIEI